MEKTTIKDYVAPLSLDGLAANVRADEKNSPKDTTNLVSRMAEARELSKNPEVIKEVFKYGKVPVIYGPTKSMVKKPSDPGLKSLILQATTAAEVENLLSRGKTEYKKAGAGTIRKWEKMAARRLKELAKK